MSRPINISTMWMKPMKRHMGMDPIPLSMKHMGTWWYKSFWVVCNCKCGLRQVYWCRSDGGHVRRMPKAGNSQALCWTFGWSESGNISSEPTHGYSRVWVVIWWRDPLAPLLQYYCRKLLLTGGLRGELFLRIGRDIWSSESWYINHCGWLIYNKPG